MLSSDGHLYVFDGSAWVDHGATGGGGGSGTVGSQVVDVGANPVSEAWVSFAVAGLLTTSRIIASVVSDARSQDELELEPIDARAHCAVNGTMRVLLSASRPGGSFSGTWRVNYIYT